MLAPCAARRLALLRLRCPSPCNADSTLHGLPSLQTMVSTIFFHWLLNPATKKRGLIAGLVKSYKERTQARLMKEASERKKAKAAAAAQDAARAAAAAAGM